MQERQFPESDSEQLTSAEKRAHQRVRTRRLQGLAAGVGAGMLALFSVGCPEPADLQGANQFPAVMSGGSGGSGGGGSTPTCETACVNQIFQKDQQPCLLCHSKLNPLGGLELESPGYTDRLKNQPAKHTGITGSTADCPTGDKLIDTTTPANSWFLKKIRNEQKTCGTVMPQAGTMTAEQKTCLETYVACVAGGSVMPGGGGTAAGGGTGGGGAASGGTGTGGGGAASGGTAAGGGGGGGAAAGGGGSGGTAGGGGGGGGGGTGGA